MKILITNTVALNGGDAAILIAIIRLLRDEFGAGVEIVVFDNNPTVASRLYPGIAFRKLLYLFLMGNFKWTPLRILVGLLNRVRFRISLWCWGKGIRWVSKELLSRSQADYLREYVTADLVVSTGGTYLNTRYSLRSRVFDYAMVRLARRPLVFFTQSMGPFKKRWGLSGLRRAIDEAVVVMVRDEQSRRHLLTLGVRDQHVYNCSDVAFALASEETLEQVRLGECRSNAEPKIAISVRHWPYFETVSTRAGMDQFEKAMAILTEHLVTRYNAQVLYVSTCQGVPEYAYDDSSVAERIWSRLSHAAKRCVHVDRHFHAPDDLMALLKPFDLIVATRMHMAILGLTAGVPVLPIAYEFKTSELFNRLGLGAWVQQIEGIDGDTLTTTIDAFLAAIATLRSPLFDAVRRERDEAIRSARLVSEMLAK